MWERISFSATSGFHTNLRVPSGNAQESLQQIRQIWLGRSPVRAGGRIVEISRANNGTARGRFPWDRGTLDLGKISATKGKVITGSTRDVGNPITNLDCITNYRERRAKSSQRSSCYKAELAQRGSLLGQELKGGRIERIGFRRARTPQPFGKGGDCCYSE